MLLPQKMDSILKTTSSYKVQENFVKNCGVKFACPSLVNFLSPKEKKRSKTKRKTIGSSFEPTHITAHNSKERRGQPNNGTSLYACMLSHLKTLLLHTTTSSPKYLPTLPP